MYLMEAGSTTFVWQYDMKI